MHRPCSVPPCSARLAARLTATLPTLVAMGLLAGCQNQTYVDRQKVESAPLTVDEAMQQRVWPPVTAYYESGSTFSGSTGFAYTANHDLGPLSYAVTDTGTYLLNVVTLPYTLFDQREGVESGGVRLPPSYTAVPPAIGK